MTAQFVANVTLILSVLAGVTAIFEAYRNHIRWSE